MSLRVDEVENRELAVFLFTSGLSSEANANFEEEPATFSLSHNGIEFDVALGIERSLGELTAYTVLEFDAPLDCDLSVFDASPSPSVVPGRKRPGSSIAAVRYFGDQDESHLFTEEDLRIEAEQEAEAAQIDSKIHDLFPTIAEVISRIREAARLELFTDAIRWDFLIESIKTVQRNKQVAMAEMDPFFDDAAYLFSAFRPKGAARFPQDSNVHYVLEDTEGRSFEGVIRNTRTGKSPVLFANSVNAIQERIDNPGSIQDRILLAACEFLYADDFRMAVFNAATVLELTLVRAYESDVNAMSREAAKIEHEVADYKKSNKVPHTVALLRVYAPKNLSPSRDWRPLIDRCVDAWNYRDKTVAHLTTPQRTNQLSRTEAWEMVVSVSAIITDMHAGIAQA